MDTDAFLIMGGDLSEESRNIMEAKITLKTIFSFSLLT